MQEGGACVKRIQVHKLSTDELNRRGVAGWGIWEKGPSEFEWHYTTEEHCFVVQGRARITHGGKTVEIRKGDYAVFPAGLACTWKVIDVIKKRYTFHPPQVPQS